MKFKKPEASWQKFHNDLMCELTAHYTCRDAEMNLKSTTTNRFDFQIIYSLMESWVVGLTVRYKKKSTVMFMHV